MIWNLVKSSCTYNDRYVGIYTHTDVKEKGCLSIILRSWALGLLDRDELRLVEPGITLVRKKSK
jgi:hypothetical protein